MAKGGGGGQQGQGQGNDALYISAFIVLVAAYLWWQYSPEITHGVFRLRLFEIDVFEGMIDLLSHVAGVLHIPLPNVAHLDKHVHY